MDSTQDTDNKKLYAIRLKDLLNPELIKFNLSNGQNQIYAEVDRSQLESKGIILPAQNGSIYFIANFEQAPIQAATNEYDIQTIPTIIELFLIFLVVMLWVISLIFLYKRYSIISQSRNKPYQSYNEVKKSLEPKRGNSSGHTQIIIDTNDECSKKTGSSTEKILENTTETTSLQQVGNTSSKFLQNNTSTYPTLTTDNSLEANTNSYSESFTSSNHINKRLFSENKHHKILRSLDENHLSYSTNDSFLKKPTNLQALAKSAPNSSNELPQRHYIEENRYNLFDVSLTALHQYQQQKQKSKQKTFKLLKARSQCQSNSRSKLLSEDLSTVSLKYNPNTNQTTSFLRKSSTPIVQTNYGQPLKSSSYLSIAQNNKVTRQINPVSSMKRHMFVNSRNNRKCFTQTTNHEICAGTMDTTLSSSIPLTNRLTEEIDTTIEEKNETGECASQFFLKPSWIPMSVKETLIDLHKRTKISKSDSNIRNRKSQSPISVDMHKYASCKETRCKKQLSLQETDELNEAFFDTCASINGNSNSIETSASKLNDENLTA